MFLYPSPRLPKNSAFSLVGSFGIGSGSTAGTGEGTTGSTGGAKV